MQLVWFCVALFATTLGAGTGMGGGVIIRPLMDLFGEFSSENITVLSHITVFAMAAVALLCLCKSPNKPSLKEGVPLAIGSVLGSGAGNISLMFVFTGTNRLSDISVVQSILLAALIIGVSMFMMHREGMPTLIKPKGYRMMPYALVGIALGLVSSLLGIGGGFVNVALLSFVFGFKIKKAVLFSLTSILFSQAARIAQIFIVKDTAHYDFSPLPYMLVGGIVGGILGSVIHNKGSDKGVNRLFNITQLVALVLCLMNIVRNWDLL